MDAIANLIININNGIQANKSTISVPPSKLLNAVAQVLLSSGYIAGYKTEMVKIKHKMTTVERSRLIITLKYDETSKPAITVIKQISKQGLRIYKDCKELPHVLNNLGIAIVSTNKGIITDKQARKEHVGGEIIAYVW
ncbi:MAG: 30S ribosomal protein S8 [Mycoplasmataceae bacterium]|jgi:small subunit ribosomal protein S8|nr:30S ribosomal protein S8 [Mycoplasmataceae bacterium]